MTKSKSLTLVGDGLFQIIHASQLPEASGVYEAIE
jgi:hypothetical protein